MGGMGSGRWGGHRKATTVEACLDLAVRVFAPTGRPPRPETTGVLRWLSQGVGRAAVGYRIEPGPLVRLRYVRPTISAGPIELSIRLVSVGMPRGGVKWAGRCPLAVNGLACRRRVSILYLPPGERYFGCRVCHRLVYQSSQSWNPDTRGSFTDPGSFARLERRIPGMSFRDLIRTVRMLSAEMTLYDRLRRRLDRAGGTWPRNDVTFEPETPTPRTDR